MAARRSGGDPTVAEVGEFEVIRRVTAASARGYGDGPGGTVVVGSGDDAAVLTVDGGRVAVCTDMLVEGRHFRLDWSAPQHVGHKAIAQNAADIAAMGGVCTGFVVSVGCPPHTPVRLLEGIGRGAGAQAARAGAPIVGGDLVQAGQIVVNITALGALPEGAAVRRDGAAAGDVVALRGRTGRSAAGLALLQAGFGDAPPTRAAGLLLTAHRGPLPPYEAGPEAARAGATAMIDVSDGLTADLGHVAAASSVTVDLDPAALTPPEDLVDAAQLVGADPWDWVLGGGEDHALAATFPPGVDLPPGWRAVGRVSAGGPDVLVGGRRQGVRPGWVAFER